MILIDSGPVIALLNRRDVFHRWVCDQMEALRPPLHTCESVISESCFRLAEAGVSTSGVFDLLERRIVVVSFDLQAEHAAIGALMDKYSNLPMDLADACLVRMAESRPGATVITTDGDFVIYRQHTRQVVPAIIPQQIRDRALRRYKRRGN